jgi:hypothetical protein
LDKREALVRLGHLRQFSGTEKALCTMVASLEDSWGMNPYTTLLGFEKVIHSWQISNSIQRSACKDEIDCGILNLLFEAGVLVCYPKI